MKVGRDSELCSNKFILLLIILIELHSLVMEKLKFRELFCVFFVKLYDIFSSTEIWELI